MFQHAKLGSLTLLRIFVAFLLKNKFPSKNEVISWKTFLYIGRAFLNMDLWKMFCQKINSHSFPLYKLSPSIKLDLSFSYSLSLSLTHHNFHSLTHNLSHPCLHKLLLCRIFLMEVQRLINNCQKVFLYQKFILHKRSE